MKTKSVSRIKLLFILLPIMTVAFYALSSIIGGSAYVFVPSEIVEHVSDMSAPPTSGSPTDYTPLENLAFANWNIYNASYFEAISEGTAKADIGFTKYSQNVRNLRKVKDKNVFTETVSVSALVKNAEQMYITASDAVAYRTSASIHGSSVTWSDEILPMSTTAFFSRYGSVPREITKYSVTAESVTSAKLISVGGGLYTYEFELDPEIGGKYFRNEISTRAGSSQPAEMISMKLTVTMDENWYVQTSTSVDSYKVSIPALGALVTTSEMTETFSYINEDRDIPERELFEPYLPKGNDEIPDKPIEENKNASAYLSEAFAPYLDGRPLNVKADINMVGTSHTLALGLDISSMNVNALLDDALYFGYDGKKIYLDAGAVRGYLPSNALSRPETDLLLGSLGSLVGGSDLPIASLSGFDIKAELRDDILDKLFENSDFVTENGLAIISLDFKLSDLLKPDSSLASLAKALSLKVDLVINDGEELSLNKIDALVKINSLPISVSIVPNDDLVFPDVSGLPSLEPLLNFITPIVNTSKGAAFDLSVNADVRSGDFNETVTADMTLNRDLTLDGDLTIDGLDAKVRVCYVGETVYLSCGNLKVKFDVADKDELIGKISAALPAFGINVPELDLPSANEGGFDSAAILSLLLENDLKDVLALVKEFSITDNSLRLSVVVDGNTYGVTLTHDGKYLTSLTLDEMTFGDVALSIGATLSVRNTPKKITVSGEYKEYIDINDVSDLLKPIADAVTASGYDIDFDLDIGGLIGNGNIRISRKDDRVDMAAVIDIAGLSLKVTLKDGVIYLECGEIRIKADKEDKAAIENLVGMIMSALGNETDGELLGKLSGMLQSSFDLGDLNIRDISENILRHMTFGNGALNFYVKAGDIPFVLTVGTKTNAPLFADVTVYLKDSDTFAKAGVTLKELNNVREIKTPSGLFASVRDLAAIVESAMHTASGYNCYDLALDIRLDDIVANMQISFNRDLSAFKAHIAVDKYGVEADIVYTNETVYVSALGIEIKATKDEIGDLVSLLAPLLPDKAGDMIAAVKDVIGKLKDGDMNGLKELLPQAPAGNGGLAQMLSSLDLSEPLGKLTYLYADENCVKFSFDDVGVLLTRKDGLLELLELTNVPAFSHTFGMELKLIGVSETARDISAPVGNYSSLKDILSLANDAVATTKKAAFEIKGSITVGKTAIDLTLALNGDLSVVSAVVAVPDYGITANITCADSVAYISTLGANIMATAQELEDLQEQLIGIIPKKDVAAVRTAFAAVQILLSQNNGSPLSLNSFLSEIETRLLPTLNEKVRAEVGDVIRAVKSLLGGDVKDALNTLKSRLEGMGTDKNVNISESARGLSLTFDKNGIYLGFGDMSATLLRENGLLSSLSLGGIGGISLDLTLTTSDTPLVFTPDENIEYTKLKDLTRFVSPTYSLTQNNAFVIGFDAVISLDDPAATQHINGELQLLLTKNEGVKFQITLDIPQETADGQQTSFRHIVLACENGNYYIVYDGMAVHATEADGTALVNLLSPYLPAFTPKLIEEITNSVSDKMPSFGIASLVGMVERIYLPSENELTAELTLLGYPVKVSLKLATDESGTDYVGSAAVGINIRSNDRDMYVSADLTLKDHGADADERALSLIGTRAFTEAGDLTEYVSALLTTFTQEAYDVTLDGIEVRYPEQNRTDLVSGHIKFLPTGKGIPNLIADIFVSQNRNGAVKEHTFDIMITDGDPLQEIYLTYNGVNFKLTIDEVLYLLGNVKDVLGIEDGTLIDKILPKDREIVSGRFLNDFDISMLIEIGDTANAALKLITDVYNEAHEFMTDPDYNYNGILDTAKTMLSSFTSLIGIDNIPSPDATTIFNMLSHLPSVSLSSTADSKTKTSTMLADVNGTTFTLTRTLEGKPYLSEWAMNNLKSEKTVGDFKVTMVCPDSSSKAGKAAIEAISSAVERPKYHDYTHGTSKGGTYKKQELRDRIARGEIAGVSLPYSDYGYINYFETFTENDIISDYVHTKGIFKTAYVKVRTGDSSVSDYRKDSYLGQSSFAERMNSEEIIAVYKGKEPQNVSASNVEYWTKTYYESKIGILIDNGSQTTFDAYFKKWFNSVYGMSVEDYTAAYLDGHILNDLSDMVSLTTALLNTANLKDFHISGNLNVNIIGAIKTNVPIDVRIKIVDGKPLIAISLSTSEVLLGALKESASQIYYYDGFVYFVKLDNNKKYNYVKVSTEQLLADMGDTNTMMKYVYYVAPFANWIQSIINNQINKDKTTDPMGAFEDYFKGYYYDNNGHYLSLDLGVLTGDKSTFSNADIILGTQTKNVGDYAEKTFGENETLFGDTDRTFISTLYFKTTLVSVVQMTLNANMGIGETVEKFRIPTYSGNSIVYNENNFVSFDNLPAYLAKVNAFIETSGVAGTIDSPAQRSADVWLG